MNDQQPKMTLPEAVASLDHGINAHWTKGGKPDLNALRELTGSDVTRDEVEKGFPDVSRRPLEGAAAGAPTGDAGSAGIEALENEQVTVISPEETPAGYIDVNVTAVNGGEITEQTYRVRDFVSELDDLFGSMPPAMRTYCEALFRTAGYYKSERPQIVRQLELAMQSDRIVRIGQLIEAPKAASEADDE